MPTFKIQAYETIVNNYEVKAANMTQALLTFRSTSGKFVNQEDLEPEPNMEVGLSFEEAPAEIDLEAIRSDFNLHPDDDYIESIHHIEEVK